MKPKLEVVLKHVNKIRKTKGLKARKTLPKGHQNCISSCVIANCFPQACAVEDYSIDFDPNNYEDHPVTSLSRPLQKFIVEFDLGDYPELEL